MFRRRRRPASPVEEVQPATLPPRWAAPVQSALAARERFQALVETLREGPLRSRLGELAGRVDAGVLAVWHAAARASELDALLATIDVADATAAHKAAMRDVEAARRRGDVPPELEQRADALADRHASVHRLLNQLDDTGTRLGLLDARLEATVARAAEVALRPDDSTAPLAADLDGVVDELGALRRALDGLEPGHR